MQFNITGYSTALFSTWYFIDELGLLFDAGEGLTSALLRKSCKINHVFISHADRDHLTGLLSFNQLNSRPGYPVIYYPKDCGSFPVLKDFSIQFDPHVSGTVWQPVTHETETFIKDDIFIQAIPNGHIPSPENSVKSLSYKIMQTRQKLRPELTTLSGKEIRRIIEERGTKATHIETHTNLLSYSGDTPVEDPERWHHSKILIHEATFLRSEEDAGIQPYGNHSYLEEVLEMVSGTQIETLILGHFSLRYSSELINRSIRDLCEKYAINIPVFAILPGKTVADILKSEPVNK